MRDVPHFISIPSASTRTQASPHMTNFMRKGRAHSIPSSEVSKLLDMNIQPDLLLSSATPQRRSGNATTTTTAPATPQRRSSIAITSNTSPNLCRWMSCDQEQAVIAAAAAAAASSTDEPSVATRRGSLPSECSTPVARVVAPKIPKRLASNVDLYDDDDSDSESDDDDDDDDDEAFEVELHLHELTITEVEAEVEAESVHHEVASVSDAESEAIRETVLARAISVSESTQDCSPRLPRRSWTLAHTTDLKSLHRLPGVPLFVRQESRDDDKKELKEDDDATSDDGTPETADESALLYPGMRRHSAPSIFGMPKP